MTILTAKPTNCSNALKQFVGKFPTNCLSVFDHFVWLARKGLTLFWYYPQQISWFILVFYLFTLNKFERRKLA